MLTFVETQKKHIKELTNIYNYYIENSISTFHKEKWNKKQMKKLVFFDDILYGTFTIMFDKEIIGYCMISPFNFREAYRATVFVAVYLKEEFTGKGYGEKALQYLEKKALGLPIRSLIALVCLENIESVKLFEKCDYKRVGVIKKAGVKFNRLLDVVYYQKVIRSNFL
ncbi:MAG: N-acetyltransferase [Clostridiales bacterium]|nr:N-acetyltransferase [Clostridiales bacterium]